MTLYLRQKDWSKNIFTNTYLKSVVFRGSFTFEATTYLLIKKSDTICIYVLQDTDCFTNTSLHNLVYHTYLQKKGKYFYLISLIKKVSLTISDPTCRGTFFFYKYSDNSILFSFWKCIFYIIFSHKNKANDLNFLQSFF